MAINGTISQALAAAKDRLEKMQSTTGLYEAIAELPNRQFEVIVLRYLVGYPTSRVAWFIGIGVRQRPGPACVTRRRHGPLQPQQGRLGPRPCGCPPAS
ncbi:hypothetical protein GCM10010309_78940 [Streptomyces violaceochromogenes]|nr:hypothetical protein GCM10010309_78940 [Streptomyces violaceochromogenes]